MVTKPYFGLYIWLINLCQIVSLAGWLMTMMMMSIRILCRMLINKLLLNIFFAYINSNQEWLSGENNCCWFFSNFFLMHWFGLIDWDLIFLVIVMSEDGQFLMVVGLMETSSRNWSFSLFVDIEKTFNPSYNVELFLYWFKIECGHIVGIAL